MADVNKNLVIKIDADVNEASRKIGSLGNDIEKVTKTMDAATGQWSTSIQLAAKSVAQLSQSFNKFQQMYDPEQTGAVRGTVNVAEKQVNNKSRADDFRSYSQINEKVLSQQISLSQTARLTGADSTATLAQANAQKELAIWERLKTDRLAIEAQLRDGIITTVKQAEDLRVKLARQAGNEIIALQKQVEAARRAETNRVTSANVFSQQSDTELAQLNQRLALARSIRVNGLNDIKTIELRAAQEEIRIRQDLTNKLADLERKLATDTTTNRLKLMSQVAGQRAALISGTEAQITSNRVTLEAAQAQARQEAETRKNTLTHSGLAVRIIEIIGLYRIYNAAINTTLNSLRAIPHIGIQLEATNASLISTMNSSAGAGSAMAALDAEAERTGLTIDSLRSSFRTFQASTSLAGESLESTWKMFTNINTVSAALHLTTDQTNGVFLALAQIFNKTKVQSEELVKQLGNLLPGAFASFQAANKDMFRNSAELIAKMKLGVVTAHDTVEKFTTFLAERFSGAFTAASQGLNANIGRMQTSFTHLGEAIYTSTKGPMLAFVKGLTDVANWITEDIKGANKLGEVMQTVLNVGVSLAGASFAVMAGKVALATKEIYLAEGAVAALGRTFSFISAPTAILAGLILIGQHMLRLGEDAKKAEKNVLDFLTAYKEKAKEVTEAGKLKIEIDKDTGVQDALSALKEADKAIEEREALKRKAALATNPAAKWAFFSDNDEVQLRRDYARRSEIEVILEKARAESLKKIQEKQELANLESLDTRAKERARLQIEALQSEGKSVEAARLQIEAQHKALYEESKQRIEKAPPSMLQSDAEREELEKAKVTIKDYETLWNNAGKTGLHERVKAEKEQLQTDYSQINALIKEATSNEKKYLSENDAAYAQNKISIFSYYKEKQEIQLRSLESQQALQREIARTAANTGDTSKVADAEGKLSALEESKGKITADIVADKYKDLEAYNQKLQEQSALALKRKGELQESVLTEFRAKNKEFHDRLQSIANDTSGNVPEAEREKAQKGLQDYRANEQAAALTASLDETERRAKAIMDKYNDSIQTTNALVQTGSNSALTGQIKNAAAATDAMETLQKEAEEAQRNIDAAIAAGYAIPEPELRRVAALKKDLAELKVAAHGVLDVFTNQMGQAFERSFSGVLTGATSGKQAFHDFAVSVQKDIADIVAQEVRSALFKAAGVENWGALAVKGIGALLGAFAGGGSGVSEAAGNSASFSSSMANLNWGTASANGNVFSGPGISAYSNTIVTQPTFFAKGGNVMGEAGPEAILPLSRNSQGKLGVVATGSGGLGSIVIEQLNVTVQSKDDATSKEQSEAISAAIKEQLKTLIDSRVVNAQRSGGVSNPTQMAVNF